MTAIDNQIRLGEVFKQISDAVELIEGMDASKIDDIKRMRDKIFHAISQQLQSEHKELPVFLQRHCLKCGTYYVILNEDNVCDNCVQSAEQKPKPGKLRRYIHTVDITGKPVKYLGQITGNTFQDLARFYTIWAKAHGYTHWIFGGKSEFKGDYANAKDELISAFIEKVK